jgi:DNA-binding MarR family transcriptional regulator
MGTMAPPDETRVDLAFLLSHVSHTLTTEMAASLACVGISPRAQCVLSRAMTGEFTQGQIAEMSELDKTTMVVTIDELEKAGLAERRPSSADRRARIIAVTDAGRRAVAQGEQIIACIYEDVLGSLPERQRQAFVDALATLAGGRLAHPVPCERPPRRRAPKAPAAVS